MELKLFGFIEDVLEALEEKRPYLEKVAEEVEAYFEDILGETEKGYLNINTRVKSASSLKEKIIRNQYYQKYDTKELLFKNVPDIIGIRIECRFIQDETDLYKFMKRFFNEKSEEDNDLFFNRAKPHIMLKLSGRQPQEQKNGMKIYRIDGKYIGSEVVNFEMQIKSLVNIFWGEIEHKVIYKNYNYVIADQFYKDIMKSIKNSLSTMDQQLLLISNQLDQRDEGTYITQEKGLEKVLAKVIYDRFAARMKESIGVLVDFKKSCEAIVRYVFRDLVDSDEEKRTKNLFIGFEKVRNIDQEEIDFKKKLEFEKTPCYEDEYIELIGRHIESRLNEEFQWNLFFRILFAIEPENNQGDFENFIHYYGKRIYYRINSNKLLSNFTDEETREIINELLIVFAEAFVKINSIELLYDTHTEQVIRHMNSIVDAIYKNVLTYEQWEMEKEIYINLLEVKLLMMFNIDVEMKKALAILDGIRATKSSVEVPKGMMKYIYKLD